MKKLNKLAAAMAVALGLGISSQAGAIGYNPIGMDIDSENRGDTLLFPVFYGYGENYFTISNSSDKFIQGHLRFRGAAWSGELLDFDVILTPGDVFVFRVADIDGDGYWEIDQSFDPLNFEYTGMLDSCGPESGAPGVAKSHCMDQSTILIPPPTNTRASNPGGITPELIEHHRHVGYVEFIGEGVFNEMTHELLYSFIDPSNAGKLSAKGQREVGNKLGTSLWSWVLPEDYSGRLEDIGYDAVNRPPYLVTRTASDVPNALSGTAFISGLGFNSGLAYNAEAITNFRTNLHTHRVDNYDPDFGVIIHHENAIANPDVYYYVYGYGEERAAINIGNDISFYESRVSFNNTWGPTLADGDDYNGNTSEGRVLSQLRNVLGDNDDSFDVNFGIANSLAEVEEAVREAVLYGSAVDSSTIPNSSRQTFSSFYLDGGTTNKSCEGNGREDGAACPSNTLQSWYFAFFPTKFFYVENALHWRNFPNYVGRNDTDKLLGARGYLEATVEHALALPKPFRVELLDIYENMPGEAGTCVKSPCIPPEFSGDYLAISQELGIFTIRDIKNTFKGVSNHQAWDQGRVTLQVLPAANLCNNSRVKSESCYYSFPAMLYTFEMGSDGAVVNWREMQH